MEGGASRECGQEPYCGFHGEKWAGKGRQAYDWLV